MNNLTTDTNREILTLFHRITQGDIIAVHDQVGYLVNLRRIDINTPYTEDWNGHRNLTALCFVAMTSRGLGKFIAQVLIQNGADVNKSDDDKFTPLHFACESSEDHALVEFLVEQGSKLLIRNADGNRPQDLIGRPGGWGYLIKLYLKGQTHNLR